MIAVRDQRPLRGAIVAQPVVFDLPLLLAGANEGRGDGLSRLGHPVGLDQKQLAFPESEEGFRTSRIGALAEHISRFTATPKIGLSASDWILFTSILRATWFHHVLPIVASAQTSSSVTSLLSSAAQSARAADRSSPTSCSCSF